MSSRSSWLACVLVSLAACASSEKSPQGRDAAEAAAAQGERAESTEDDARDKADKRAKLERELTIEIERLSKVKVELTHLEKANAEATRRADNDLALAREQLRSFDEKESKTRLDKARLDLQEAKDSFDEAREEVEQLELMYKEQDLADKTREIVLRRGKRRLERAQQRLALEQRDLDLLEKDSLPQERAKHAIAFEEKTHAVDRVHRESEEALLEKRIAVMSAEAEIARLHEEIASIERSAKK